MEIAARLHEERGIKACVGTIWKFFDKFGITYKKRHASEQDRADVWVARERWFEGQLDLDPARLVFIDESGASTKMARLRGRTPKGERCRATWHLSPPLIRLRQSPLASCLVARLRRRNTR
jgi:hypothetical protein